jgi:hypothetical protein
VDLRASFSTPVPESRSVGCHRSLPVYWLTRKLASTHGRASRFVQGLTERTDRGSRVGIAVVDWTFIGASTTRAITYRCFLLALGRPADGEYCVWAWFCRTAMTPPEACGTYFENSGAWILAISGSASRRYGHRS